MIKQAIIKPKLTLIQLNIIVTLKNVDINDILKQNFNYQITNCKKYLQSVIDQLYNKQWIQDKSIIINYISNLIPTQITFSVDCQLVNKSIKQLQTCLLQNNFQLKIIL